MSGGVQIASYAECDKSFGQLGNFYLNGSPMWPINISGRAYLSGSNADYFATGTYGVLLDRVPSGQSPFGSGVSSNTIPVSHSYVVTGSANNGYLQVVVNNIPEMGYDEALGLTLYTP